MYVAQESLMEGWYTPASNLGCIGAYHLQAAKPRRSTYSSCSIGGRALIQPLILVLRQPKSSSARLRVQSSQASLTYLRSTTYILPQLPGEDPRAYWQVSVSLNDLCWQECEFLTYLHILRENNRLEAGGDLGFQ
ncbi:hypothetical protein TWF694_005173 [Orbilia ellipsospora]|uniref:Uncharacterized protein n=1 Tax=Orbilia ellipsospora TaxID=2528407 RepID=A0AAV9WW27_9PEZI